MKNNNSNEKSHYGISAVARLTGITVHTLRVWESRYSAINASRTDSGHRHYTRQDVERLQLLKFLVDRGSAISNIATLGETALRQRVAEFESSPSVSDIGGESKKPRVAVFGNFLHLQSGNKSASNNSLEIILGTSDMHHYKADIKRLKPDILVLEFTIIDATTSALVAELQRISGARRIFVIYSYARDIDVLQLSDDVVSTFRAPVSFHELSLLIRASGPFAMRTQVNQPLQEDAGSEDAESEERMEDIPARRYSQSTLARLANTSSSIDCECPHHLVGLVVNLSHFEDYSASCANRNAEDAALHAYLQHTTAKARAMMEEALERVAIAEGLL